MTVWDHIFTCHVKCQFNWLLIFRITFYAVNKWDFINDHKNSYNCEFMDIINFTNNYRFIKHCNECNCNLERNYPRNPSVDSHVFVQFQTLKFTEIDDTVLTFIEMC